MVLRPNKEVSECFIDRSCLNADRERRSASGKVVYFRNRGCHTEYLDAIDIDRIVPRYAMIGKMISERFDKDRTLLGLALEKALRGPGGLVRMCDPGSEEHHPVGRVVILEDCGRRSRDRFVV